LGRKQPKTSKANKFKTNNIECGGGEDSPLWGYVEKFENLEFDEPRLEELYQLEMNRLFGSSSTPTKLSRRTSPTSSSKTPIIMSSSTTPSPSFVIIDHRELEGLGIDGEMEEEEEKEELESKVQEFESISPHRQFQHSSCSTPILQSSMELEEMYQSSMIGKNFQSSHWNPPSSCWVRSVDLNLSSQIRKHLKRNCDDDKYRTRLCNHFQRSGGVTCPMRDDIKKKKKKKSQGCHFAHGPIELRSKMGRLRYWGNQNQSEDGMGSGGEDSYGAARKIERIRQTEGSQSHFERTGRKYSPKQTRQQKQK